MTRYRKEPVSGLVLLAKATIKEGKREEALAALDAAVELAQRHEPDGASTLFISASPANANVLYLEEHYPSRESLEFHRSRYRAIPEYAESTQRIQEVLASPLEVEVLVPIARYDAHR